MRSLIISAVFAWNRASAFQPGPSTYTPSGTASRLFPGSVPSTRLASSAFRTPEVPEEGGAEKNISPAIWSPPLRKTLIGLSAVGAMETGYLSFVKLTGGMAGIEKLCGAAVSGAGTCGDVLNGPYANYNGVPLTILGFLAYSLVAVLAAVPLISRDQTVGEAGGGDASNRLALTTVTSGMAAFSAVLISLLLVVIQIPCPFCIVSAIISASLGAITWFGGAARGQTGKAAGGAMASVAFMLTAGMTVFLHGEDMLMAQAVTRGDPSMLVAGRKIGGGGGGGDGGGGAPPTTNVAPPKITESSSERAMAVARDLNALDAKMFGAFWCSHCYDQKQMLGKEAMGTIKYIECDKDGKNSQRPLCQETKVPGYPTWQIAGKLYPGEQSLNELEEIIAKAKIAR